MNDMTRRSEEILSLLDQEIGLHRDLLELSRREQGLLVTLDTEALAGALNDVEEVAGKIRSVMETRLNLLAALAEEIYPGRTGVTGGGTVSSSGGRDRARRYRDMLEYLRPILEEHSVINAGNMVLIKNILDYVDFAAGVLASRSGQNTYTLRKVGRPHAFPFSRP